MNREVSKSDLRDTWESAAPGWATWEHEFSANLTDATDVLLDLAGVESGMRVLDLACGAGIQSIQAARRVGPSGTVVASDISGTMLEHVRKNARGAGLDNIETLECAAEDLAEVHPPFDASFSRLGLMLFASPSSALRALHGALKPNGRFAALVFTTPANNPFMAQPMQIALRHSGKEPPGPGQPGIFALGGDGNLEELLIDGGLKDIETRTVRAPLRLATASDGLEMMQQAFGAYRAVLATLDETEKSKAWAEIHTCLRQFETESGFNTELEFIIGSGAKPS